MSWRGLAINAIVSFAITIAAGIIVFLVTKQEAQKDHLVYDIVQSATFGGNMTNISLISVKIRNNGTAPADNVRLLAQPDGAPIRDKQIDPQGGTTLGVVDRSSPGQLDISVPRLLPSEEVTIGLLLAGRGTISQVSLRSATSKGKPGIPSKEASGDVGFWIAIASVAIALFLQASITEYLERRSRRNRPDPVDSGARNDFAFVLLHRGLTEEAERLLQLEKARGAPGPYELGNLALIEALRGNFETASTMNSAALWWADFRKSKETQAFLLFNQCLLMGLAGNIQESVASLKRSLSIREGATVAFGMYSTHFQKLAETEPELRKLLEEASAEAQAKHRKGWLRWLRTK